jgi:hypothetical protein
MFKIISRKEYKELLKVSSENTIRRLRQSYLTSEAALKKQQALEFLYQPVFTLSDEWENPVVGWVTSVDFGVKGDSNACYTIFNWLTGTTVYALSVNLWCNMDKSSDHYNSGVLPLMDLNPHDRWNLMNVHYRTIYQLLKRPEPGSKPNLTTRSGMYRELTITGYFNTVERVAQAGTPNLARSILMSIISDRETETLTQKESL